MALGRTLGFVGLGSLVLGYGAHVIPPSESAGQATTDWTLNSTIHVSNPDVVPYAGYLPPTYKGAWDKTSGAVTGRLGGPGENTHVVSVAKGVTTNPYRVLVYRGVSGPLAAQLIHGTVDIFVEIEESNADASLFWYVHAYVTAGDTDSVRGTLIGDHANTINEWPAGGAVEITFDTPIPLNPVLTTVADRMVFELGYISTAANDRTGSITLGINGLTFSTKIREVGPLASVGFIGRPAVDTSQQRIDVGFAPKLVLFFIAHSSGVGAHLATSIGFTDGSRSACRSGAASDDVAASDDSAGDTESAVIWMTDRSEVTTAKAVLVRFDDSGFVIQWVVNSASAPYSEIGYLALGGDDVEAHVGRVPSATLGTGVPQTVTIDDIGWTPTALIILPSRLGIGTTEAIVASGELAGIGFATLSPVSNAYAAMGELLGVNPTQTYRRQITNKSFYVPDVTNSGTLGDPVLEGAVVEPTADGFSMSWSTANAGGHRPYYIALRGVRAALVRFDAPTSSDNPLQHIETPFVPMAAILASFGNVTTAGTTRTNRAALTLAVTAFDGAAGMWAGVADAVTPTQVNQVGIFGQPVLQLYNQGASSPALNSEASVGFGYTLQNMGLDLNWDFTDTGAREIIGLVLGAPSDEATMVDPDGGGTPTTGSNPGADATLSATVPLALVTIQTDSGEQRYGKSTVSAPSTYQIPGWIEGRVASITGIRRALSDATGALETGSCRVVLDDVDRRHRGLAESGVLLNKRVDAYLATKAQVDAGTAPRRVFQGLIRQYTPLPNLQFDVTVEDRLGALLATKTLPGTVLDVATFPNLPTELIGKPEPLCYGLLSDEALGTAAKGVVPAIFVGRRELTSSVTGKKRNWDEYLVCRGAVKQIQSWFARAYNPPHARVKMPSATENFDFLMPGRKGWTEWTGSSALYRTLNGKRYTVFYATGQRSEEAKDGRVPFALNLAGTEHLGDGTGTLIDSLPLICLHILTNWILQTATGAWMAIPTVGAPAYAQIDSASFQAVHTAAAARMLAMFGAASPNTHYRGARYLGFNGQAEDARAALKSLCHDGDFQIGANRAGQIMASMEDDDKAVAMTLRDVTDVLKGGLTIDHALTEMKNRITYRYARRYVAAMVNQVPLGPGALMPADARPPEAAWGSGDGEVTDATSITNHGETRTEDHSFEWVRGAATVQNVLQYQRERLKNGPIYVTVQTGLDGSAAELGDVIRLQHFAGLDDDGYDGTELFRVMAQTLDLNNLTVTLELHDITDL